ncbi:MAG: PfkB family carbohydrate kinase [Candidatus Krumholzibacteria bacterium]|nr:PfkB family carbohydrate kinase [Candidatus Krumholzibacteria bacterium]
MTSKDRAATILTVGSVAFDSVETPTGSVEKALGGSASYAALAASYFASPRVVAVVGDDFTDEHIRKLSERGVDVSGLERVKGKTFHWKGRYHENMQDRDTLATDLNVFQGFDPKVPDEFRDASYVFLGNIEPKIQAKVLDQVRDARFVGMDTMNFWIASALADLKSVLGRVDLLFINDEEASQLSGETQMLNAAEEILALGPRYVVIKRGEFGSLLFGSDICLFVPAVLLPKVVDPTGAGDSFAGGFLGAVARTGAINRATLAQGMIYGTVMASFAVEKFSVDGLLDHSQTTIDLRRDFLESMTTYS